jgi:dynein light chain roadblock-type
VLIVNNDGMTLKSTLHPDKTQEYAALLSELSTKARSVVRTLDSTNDLTFLRVRSKKHEIMVAPGRLHKNELTFD